MTIPELVTPGHVPARSPCRRPEDAADDCCELGGTVKQIWSVGRVASWDGFCLPCGRGDRPLVLTRSGASGLRAWLAGIDDDERTLLLTCRVCGEWQVVPLREEDDPEVVGLSTPGPATTVALAAAEPIVVRLPQRTAAVGRIVHLPAPAALPIPPARVLPATAVDVVADEVAVAAARTLLAAARAGQQRPATRRPTTRPDQRGRRQGHRRGPTPRRPDHAVRLPREPVVPVAEATSTVLPLDLLRSGHSLLLATG